MINKTFNFNSSYLRGLIKTISGFSKIFIIIHLLFMNLSPIYAEGDNIFQFKSNTFIIDWLVCGPFPNEATIISTQISLLSMVVKPVLILQPRCSIQVPQSKMEKFLGRESKRMIPVN